MSVRTTTHGRQVGGFPRAGLPLALLALLAPSLLAIDQPPSVTFYNQVMSVLGWGLWTAWLNAQPNATPPANPGAQAAFSAVGLVMWITAGSALGSVWATGLPLGLGLMAAGLALSGWWTLETAWRSAHRHGAVAVMDVLAQALAWTGVVSVVLAAVQVFAPGLTDGEWLASPTMPGRAVGNLRQPNHFSTLLFWCACGAVWLGRRKRWHPLAAQALLMGCIGAMVWTASRTGMLAMALLCVWAWRDRGMPRALRGTLALAPLVYGLWWLGMAWWAEQGTQHHFAAAARLRDGSDISSSRFKIWSDTWQLIKAHPWTGVGWGEFNLAWTFTELPKRPVAFFDHTHNLLMQWAVELGLPLALLLTGLTLWGFTALLRPWRVVPDAPVSEQQAVVVACTSITAVAGLHSLLEYPLWYGYFLLPTAFAWGLGLAAASSLRTARPADSAPPTLPASTGRRTPWAVALSLLMAVGALWCAVDYQWAANIYAPREGSGTLDERIRAGQAMPWFGYQADYALVTGPDPDEPSLPPAAFARTLHNLVDARLMIAYARSLAEHGRVDEARYVVQRLKEFKTAMGKQFLAACSPNPAAPPTAATASGAQLSTAPANLARGTPFQCEEPQRSYTWRQVLPQ